MSATSLTSCFYFSPFGFMMRVQYYTPSVMVVCDVYNSLSFTTFHLFRREELDLVTDGRRGDYRRMKVGTVPLEIGQSQ